MLKMKTSTSLLQCLAVLAMCPPFVLSDEPGNLIHHAFGVSRDTRSQTDSGTLSFPLDVSNVDAWYDHGSDSFVARSSGLYFLYVCVGVAPKSQVKVQQAGGYPRISYTWQSTNDGIKLGCRGGISVLNTGMRVGLNFQGDGIFSDKLQQTSFSAFSISGSMTSAAESLFVTYSDGPFDTIGPIPFGKHGLVYVNPTALSYDTGSNTYTCPYDGDFLVSISVGVRPGQFVHVLLIADYDLVNFELTRTSRATDGLTTLSRSVLVHCSSMSNLQVQLVDGEITSSDSGVDNLASLTVIPYAPVDQSSAWALYRTSSWSATSANTVLTFDQTGVLEAAEHNANDGTLEVSLTGTYMVYLSAATVPNQPMNLVVRRNGVGFMGLVTSPTETDGTDMVEHGVIVELDAGDVLVVVGDDGSSVYSDAGQQVGFWGFLIYDG